MYKENESYRLVIEDLVNETIPLDTEESKTILLNLTGIETPLDKGLYYIKFKITKYNETHYRIITLGTIKQDIGFSGDYKGYTGPITPSLPKFLPELSSGEAEWCVREVVKFYTGVTRYLFSIYKIQEVTMLNYPVIMDLYRYKDELPSDLFNTLLNISYTGLFDLISKSLEFLGKDVTEVIVFSPYTYTENYVEETNPGIKIVAPGILEYSSLAVSLLNSLKINYTVIHTDSTSYVLVDDPMLRINDIGGYGYGYLLFHPGTEGTKDTVIGFEQVLGYFTAFTSKVELSIRDLLSIISSLDELRSELEYNVTKLNTTIKALNNQLNDLKLKVGNLNAENKNLSLRIKDLEDQLNEEKKKFEQLSLYASAGVGAVFVVAIVLTMIIGKVSRRR